MNMVDYHIFINLLPKNIKKSFVECRQIVFIFALVRTAILFHFFFTTIEICYIFLFSSTWWKIVFTKKKKKKLEEKIINKAIKKNCKKD